MIMTWENSELNETMNDIRKVSNVIQALENLQAQSEGQEGFEHITEFARQSLLYSHKQLRRLIHQ